MKLAIKLKEGYIADFNLHNDFIHFYQHVKNCKKNADFLKPGNTVEKFLHSEIV